MKEKILLALHDQNLAKILVKHLNDAGYVAENILSGNEVIEKLKSFEPSILLVDVSLPDKSGYDVLAEKSLDRMVTKIPVIIVSNSTEPIQMKRIPSTPTIKDYLIKTHIDPEDVVLKIEKAFGRAKADDEVKPKDEDVGKGRVVLWIEDDKLLGNILSKKIDSSGFKLLKAAKDTEAFKILESNTPDIIVSDIMLPGANGLDIIQKIKMDAKFKKIPTIILSNVDSQTDVEKAKMLGVNKFIVKAAVSPDEIISSIASLIA